MWVTERSQQHQARGSQEVVGVMQDCVAANEKEKQSIVNGCNTISTAIEVKLKHEKDECVEYLTRLENGAIATIQRN